MPTSSLLSCLLLVLSAFHPALSQPTLPSQLSATHTQIEPGHWGSDFETSPSIHEWTKVSRAPGHVLHSVAFVLQARNMDLIKTIADDVADPTSPRYGQHLDIDRITQIVQAPESEIQTVTSWLDMNKITFKVSKTRHVVEAEAPVAAIEALLNCELFLFKNKEEPVRTMVRKMGPMYLPHQVAGIVRAVFNLVDPPLSRKGHVPFKPDFGPVPEPPPETNQRFHAQSSFLPKEPVPAVAQLVSVRGIAFNPVQANEPSPTAPLQMFAFLRCLNGDNMKGDNCRTTNQTFVSMSIRLFVTDPRNLFGAGSSFDFPQYIISSNIDSLCPVRPDFGNARLCDLAFNIQVPSSMSIQGSAIATFENLTQKDTSSFVILPALLPSTPQLLARLYNAPMQYTCLDNRTSFAIFSSSEVVKQDDLDAYGKWMGLTLGSMNFDNLPFEKCPNCERGEATLDVEIMLGMVKGATMWHWNFDKDGMFFYLANALLNNLTGTPDVISISYGSDEAGPVSNLLNIVNDMYAILATTAKTIMTASGDNGVYGNGCKCNIGGVPFTDKSQCSLCCGRTLSFPEWPATCPYITVVGGTAAVVAGSTPFYQNPSAAQNTNSHYHIHEIMAGSESGGVITSGGGYSSMFPARPFMQKAMLGYLKQHSSNTNLSEAIITQSSVMWPAFNSSGTLMRGYPDVSALAARIPIFLSQAPSQRLFTGGTSASTPLFASYVVMMNDLRLQAGLPKLGNILPLLYMLGDKHPDVYNDVTVGYHGVAVVKNSGCGGVCPDALDCIIGGQRQGLTAAPGWDAVTGFGSINFERIIRYVVPGNDIVSIASLMKTRSVVAENAAAAAAAATSASNASTSASNAATSASNAATSASDAATLASAAATAASAAAVSARSIASSVLINVTAALINVTAAASAAASSAVESTSTVAFNASKQADLSRNIAIAALALSFVLLISNVYLLLKVRAQNSTHYKDEVKEKLVSRFVSQRADDDGARRL